MASDGDGLPKQHNRASALTGRRERRCEARDSTGVGLSSPAAAPWPSTPMCASLPARERLASVGNTTGVTIWASWGGRRRGRMAAGTQRNMGGATTPGKTHTGRCCMGSPIHTKPPGVVNDKAKPRGHARAHRLQRRSDGTRYEKQRPNECPAQRSATYMSTMERLASCALAQHTWDGRTHETAHVGRASHTRRLGWAPFPRRLTINICHTSAWRSCHKHPQRAS